MAGVTLCESILNFERSEIVRTPPTPDEFPC